MEIQFQRGEARWSKKSTKIRSAGMGLGAYLCYMSGIYGVLAAATILGELKYEETILYVVLFCVASVLWVWMYLGNGNLGEGSLGNGNLGKGNRLLIWLLTLCVTAGTIWFHREFLLELWEKINRGEQALAQLTRGQETVFVAFFMTFGALILYELTFHVRHGFWSALAILGTMGVQIYWRLPVPLYEIGFFLIYQAGASLLHCQRGRRRRLVHGERKTAALGYGILLVEGATLLFLLAGSRLAGSSFQETLFTFPLHVEQSISKGMPRLFWTEPKSGVINRGNLQGSERERLRVEVSEEPTEFFYLKGFTGGTYTGDGFQEADEGPFYESLAGNGIFSEDSAENVEQYFEEYPFETLQWRLQVSDIHESEIWTESIEGNGIYEPYLSSYVGTEGEAEHFAFFPQKWMEWLIYYQDREIDWEGPERSDYQAYVEDMYTRLPDSGLSRLRRLCEEHPAGTREEITNQILNLLDTYAEYTITPGEIPAGEDVAEYFLFERKAGYCQHFAAAAVLMYRMYGIPARYAVGFIASPDAFSQGEDGRWQAVLTGGEAHAWAEIYVENAGWVPVETTPLGSVIGTESAETGEMEERTQAVETEAPTAPEEPETQAAATVPQSSGEASSAASQQEHQGHTYGGADLSSYLAGMVKAVAVLCGVAALAAVGARGAMTYRRRGLEKNQRSSVSRLLSRIMEMMGMIGKMKGYRGDEEAFSRELAKEIPEISEAEMQKLVEMAMQETFGNQAVTKEEQKQAQSTYRKVARSVYAQLGPLRRLYFEYVKVYD